VAFTLIEFYADEGLPLKSYRESVYLYLFLPVTQAVPIPFCTTLDFQLSFIALCVITVELAALHCNFYILEVPN
jgi:hypothetical protein